MKREYVQYWNLRVEIGELCDVMKVASTLHRMDEDVRGGRGFVEEDEVFRVVGGGGGAGF